MAHNHGALRWRYQARPKGSTMTYAQWMAEFESWSKIDFFNIYQSAMKESVEDYLAHSPEFRHALNDYAVKLGW